MARVIADGQDRCGGDGPAHFRFRQWPARNVSVMGGAAIVQQAVGQGLADELRIHLSPVLLGSGTRLFGGGEICQLRQERVQVSACATHITYRLDAGHID